MADTKQRFDSEANKVYTYSDVETLINELKDLADMVDHHQTKQVPRLSELDDYYLGNNKTILEGQRRKEEHMADHRATHNYARYISQFVVGYLTGKPIAVAHTDEKAQETIDAIKKTNDIDAINSEIELDCSVYGRAYEMVLRSQDDEDRVFLLSPLQTFVIYDNTVEQKPIAGVRYWNEKIKDEDTRVVNLYTHQNIYTYHAVEGDLSIQEGPKPHGFGGVPINEYQNNRFRQGDFENVLSLIDLYDAAQSDLANYSQDLQDAMLVIKGRLELENSSDDPIEQAKKMKQANILYMEPEMSSDGKEGKIDAGYIYKEYDVEGSEAYKNRLDNDIHKYTAIPNMSDEKFGGQQTGEAMKYKLFALEQVRATKERYFKRSLRNRYRLINNMKTKASELAEDLLKDITIEFTPNFPKNTKEEIDIFNSLGGEVSNETKLKVFPYEVDIEEEQERIEEERKRRRQASTSAYMNAEN
ncbi:phage portal protein [Sediminibacillus massiliensis]|uniref:phage portal protein n=1 Tax=Sediminibacillus massiliensis TaxID=1926277 RepID=UPI0009888040|nr:phage portal protein [Sediminibacillus massiliensis]